jgi:hypothetical protein
MSSMMGAVGAGERSHASSLNSLARSMGFVIGTALCSLVLMLMLRSEVPAAGLKLGREMNLVQLEQFSQAASAVFVGCAIVCVVAALLFWGYPNEKGRRVT